MSSSKASIGLQDALNLLSTTPSKFDWPVEQRLGAYFWQGHLLPNSANHFSQSVDFITKRGFTTIRLALNPYMAEPAAPPKDQPSGYDLASAKSAGSLGELLDNTEIDTVMKHPKLDLITLTIHDFTLKGGGLLAPSVIEAKKDALFAEYKTFFTKLRTRYNGLGKAFVVADWEGDNTLYCGDVAANSPTAALRAACSDQLKSKYGSDVTLDLAFTTYIRWHNIRRAALVAALAETTSDVKIYYGVEMNVMNFFKPEDAKSVLYNVVPAVKPDVVLYSSYDSLTHKSLTQDLARIHDVLNANGLKDSRIFIGEIGFYGAKPDVILNSFLESISSVNSGLTDVAVSYFWNAFNPQMCQIGETSGRSCFGLYQPDGTNFAAPKYASYPNGRMIPVITHVNAQPAIALSTSGAASELTIQGQFADADHNPDVTLLCVDGQKSTKESLFVDSASPTSVAVRVHAQHLNQRCRVRVTTFLGVPSEWSLPFKIH